MNVSQEDFQNGTQKEKFVEVQYFPNLLGNIYFKDIPESNKRRVFALIPFEQNSVINLLIVEGKISISNTKQVENFTIKNCQPLQDTGEKITKIEDSLLNEFAKKEMSRIDEYPSENSVIGWQENTFKNMECYYSEFQGFFIKLNNKLPNTPYFCELKKALKHFESNNTAWEKQFKEENNTK